MKFGGCGGETYEYLEKLIQLETDISNPKLNRIQTLSLYERFIPFSEHDLKFFKFFSKSKAIVRQQIFSDAKLEYAIKRKPQLMTIQERSCLRMLNVVLSVCVQVLKKCVLLSTGRPASFVDIVH
jgi:hypothetical protein